MPWIGRGILCRCPVRAEASLPEACTCGVVGSGVVFFGASPAHASATRLFAPASSTCPHPIPTGGSIHKTRARSGARLNHRRPPQLPPAPSPSPAPYAALHF
eukprot:364469-Chlamydomonas_euryale.AAC.5